ncbi:hypothetical protein [Pedobacter ureilyticus]|uniref:Uncharacterized protein n=1 Tax=Pedobacter ureilyticus TaxID=1393051 RepID=A0ABW9J1S2_9SPHI|nr:hypothetical protein [Pedobacter helvus]
MEFKHALDVQERKVTHMLIGKNASESRKLEYLIADDFDKALLVVDEQAKEFDKVLDTVKALSTDGLAKGVELKQSKLNYYRSLKTLHLYAKKEIVQQKLIRQVAGKQRDTAQNELVKLAKAKQPLYDKVYEADEKLYQTLVEFDKANGL